MLLAALDDVATGETRRRQHAHFRSVFESRGVQTQIVDNLRGGEGVINMTPRKRQTD